MKNKKLIEYNNIDINLFLYCYRFYSMTNIDYYNVINQFLLLFYSDLSAMWNSCRSTDVTASMFGNTFLRFSDFKKMRF